MQYSFKGQNGGTFDLIDTSELKYSSSQLGSDCYKITWTKGDSCSLGVDGYRVIFIDQNDNVVFADFHINVDSTIKFLKELK
jgi:hypothetical protein